MTMRKTKEAIFAMLGAANGLETHPYGPLTSKLDRYLAPGNYAHAESVERGAEGDKFSWVAYSSYGKDDYLKYQDLKAQLERVFADNQLCQDVHATIYQNEDGMAHRVEYRFHTFGVEDLEDEDNKFCPNCGWNTEHIKCNAGPDDHPSEDCHYLCSNCGTDTGITTPCIRKIVVDMEIKAGAFLTHSPNIVSAVSPDVTNAVGEILIGYALAENNLRTMLAKLPGHKSRSYLSDDIERLKKYKAAILKSASAKSADGAQVIAECIDSIIDAFEKTRTKRNALAHGQLVQVGLTTFAVGGDDTDRDKDRGSRLQIEHDGETVELTEDGIQGWLHATRELQAHIGHLGRLLEFLASR